MAYTCVVLDGGVILSCNRKESNHNPVRWTDFARSWNSAYQNFSSPSDDLFINVYRMKAQSNHILPLAQPQDLSPFL